MIPNRSTSALSDLSSPAERPSEEDTDSSAGDRESGTAKSMLSSLTAHVFAYVEQKKPGQPTVAVTVACVI